MSSSLVRKQIDVILNSQFSQVIDDRIAVLSRTRRRVVQVFLSSLLSLGPTRDLISRDSKVKLICQYDLIRGLSACC